MLDARQLPADSTLEASLQESRQPLVSDVVSSIFLDLLRKIDRFSGV